MIEQWGRVGDISRSVTVVMDAESKPAVEGRIIEVSGRKSVRD